MAPTPPTKELSDDDIRRVIADCERQKIPLKGVRVRAELLRVFGSRSSSRRVYPLLQDYKYKKIGQRVLDLEAELACRDVEIASMQMQLAQERERAELAEHREQIHQDRWASELYELRQKLMQYEGQGRLNLHAQNGADRLDLLKDLTRARNTNAYLVEILKARGISLPENLD